jgi:hypothetical protein
MKSAGFSPCRDTPSEALLEQFTLTNDPSSCASPPQADESKDLRLRSTAGEFELLDAQSLMVCTMAMSKMSPKKSFTNDNSPTRSRAL